MRRLLLPLVVIAIAAAAPRGQATQRAPASPGVTVDNWVAAALAHRPGTTDPPLYEVARASLTSFDVIARRLRGTLERSVPEPEARNDVLRRGALLHTDIALLLPDRAAAAFPSADEVVVSADGLFLDRDTGTGHWWFASWLLSLVRPHSPADEFVTLWYRAVAAHFQNAYLFGSSGHHLKRAKRVLPRDPILLFYEGAMREAMASPRFQSVPITAPGATARQIALASAGEQLQDAEHLLREAVKYGAPPEATVRLGRVVGARGRHRDAVALLEQVAIPPGDARLAYLRDLFLGTEQFALGQPEAARTSLDRASTLFPTAQAPLLAMSAIYRRTGDRQAAFDTLRRIEALPSDPDQRSDPWWDYYRSYAADADNQLASVRAWVDRKGGR